MMDTNFKIKPRRVILSSILIGFHLIIRLVQADIPNKDLLKTIPCTKKFFGETFIREAFQMKVHVLTDGEYLGALCDNLSPDGIDEIIEEKANGNYDGFAIKQCLAEKNEQHLFQKYEELDKIAEGPMTEFVAELLKRDNPSAESENLEKLIENPESEISKGQTVNLGPKIIRREIENPEPGILERQPEKLESGNFEREPEKPKSEPFERQPENPKSETFEKQPENPESETLERQPEKPEPETFEKQPENLEPETFEIEPDKLKSDTFEPQSEIFDREAEKSESEISKRQPENPGFETIERQLQKPKSEPFKKQTEKLEPETVERQPKNPESEISNIESDPDTPNSPPKRDSTVQVTKEEQHSTKSQPPKVISRVLSNSNTPIIKFLNGTCHSKKEIIEFDDLTNEEDLKRVFDCLTKCTANFISRLENVLVDAREEAKDLLNNKILEVNKAPMDTKMTVDEVKKQLQKEQELRQYYEEQIKKLQDTPDPAWAFIENHFYSEIANKDRPKSVKLITKAAKGYLSWYGELYYYVDQHVTEEMKKSPKPSALRNLDNNLNDIFHLYKNCGTRGCGMASNSIPLYKKILSGACDRDTKLKQRIEKAKEKVEEWVRLHSHDWKKFCRTLMGSQITIRQAENSELEQVGNNNGCNLT